MKKIILFIYIFCNFLGVSLAGSLIHVDAKNHSTFNQWVDTGIDLIVGNVINVTASGEGCFDNELNLCHGADGLEPNELLIDGCQLGSLVGRIDSGTQFCIGSNHNRVIKSAGRLFLAYNDTHHFDNNSGHFKVDIAIEPPLTGSSDFVSIDLDLNIFIPSATYSKPSGDSNIWVELEYKGVDIDNDHIWKLKKYGVNEQ